MADPFFEFYTAPSEAGVGTAADYMGQVGDVNIGPQPGFTVPYTTSAAPAQGFTATESGYTPTFDFSQFTTPLLPSYGYPYVGYQAPQIAYETPLSARLGTDYSTAQQLADALRGAGAAQTTAPTGAFVGGGFGGFGGGGVGGAGRTAGGVDVSAGAADQAVGADRKAAGEPSPAAGGGLGDILKSLGGLRGLTSIGGALLAYMNQQKAQQEAKDIGQQIRDYYQKAATDVRTLAMPTYGAGTTQLEQAKSGVLSPGQLQQYQARQAQLAQAAARSGGVGAIQTAVAEQQMYNQALQSDYTNALALLQVGNPQMATAIDLELKGATSGLETTLRYSMMANDAAAAVMKNLAQMGAYTPQSATNQGVA